MADEIGKSPRKEEEMDSEEYILRKRLPRKWQKRRNDVYVSKKTNFEVQMKRCRKLLESGSNEIFIHGLGVAVDRAMNIALQLKVQGLGTLEVSATTDTVELVDDLEPENEALEPETQTRNTSAIHIRVYKVDVLPTNGSHSESDAKVRLDRAVKGLQKPRSKKRKADKTSWIYFFRFWLSNIIYVITFFWFPGSLVKTSGFHTFSIPVQLLQNCS